MGQSIWVILAHVLGVLAEVETGRRGRDKRMQTPQLLRDGDRRRSGNSRTGSSGRGGSGGTGSGRLAADLGVGGQVLLRAEGAAAGRAGVDALARVHGGQVAVEVGAVAEVLAAVRALHQLALEVDGLLVPVGVGLEREAGRALRAQVARRTPTTSASTAAA